MPRYIAPSHPARIQTGLYCDFFYHYYESKKGGMNKAVKLPV